MKKITLLIFLFTSSFADEKVVLELKWLHQFQFAGYYAALEKGFYKDAGLDVEIKERDISKNNIQQVIDGEADFSIADSVLLLYKARNEPVVIVAPIFQHSPNVLITLRSSGLDSPYELKNKNITVYKDDTDGFGIFAMLKSLNIKPSMTRIKDNNSYLDLVDKKTDAYPGYLTNEPFYYKQMGVDVNIINPANYGFDLYGDMLFTSEKEAKERPQMVEKFKEVSLKGWKYALDHKEEIIRLIKRKYAKDKSIEHLRYEANALEQMIQEKSIPLGTLDKGRIEYTLSIYKKFGFITNTVPIEEYIFNPSKKKIEQRTTLTEQEQNYLKGKKVINMCIDPKWMPLEGLVNGKYVGMTSDYTELMQKFIGTPIKVVKTKDWSQSIEYGKERKCDIFSLVMPTKERLKYLDFTKPYLSLPFVIVTNLDELFINDISKVIDKKLGIVKDYAFREILRERYPTINLVDVENVKDGLEKVKDGELFGFIDTLATTGYYIQKDYIGQLKIAGKFEETWNLGIGTRNDEPILKDIFNKAIDEIGMDTKQEILSKWVSVNFERGVNYSLIIKWVGSVTVLFTIILLIFTMVNRRLKREIKSRELVEKELEKMSTTDALTSLYNRRYFNEVFPRVINSARRENENICFAILDVDYFKQYNDNYGHIAGDDVLKKLSSTMRSQLSRADDYCFRLGGEEFGLLFKDLSNDEAKQFIEKMRQSIEELHIKHGKSSVSEYVTASFGLAVRDAKDVKIYEELYREADELLYKAKENGRNRVESNV